MNYTKISETKHENNEATITYHYVRVSKAYMDCKLEVDAICKSVERILNNLDNGLIEIIKSDPSSELMYQYKSCFSRTLSIASNTIDESIKKYNISDEVELNLLKRGFNKLLDKVENVFN
jgi:hypothetical protein